MSSAEFEFEFDNGNFLRKQRSYLDKNEILKQEIFRYIEEIETQDFCYAQPAKAAISQEAEQYGKEKDIIVTPGSVKRIQRSPALRARVLEQSDFSCLTLQAALDFSEGMV